MNTALYHTPHFFLRQRRVVIPDYARCFHLWYQRNHRRWLLPALTPAQERVIFLWEQRRCDRRQPDLSIIDDHDDTLSRLAILYLHYLDTKILHFPADIAILTPDVAATRAFCRSIGMDMHRTIVRSIRNPRSLQGRTCDLALILDAHRAPLGPYHGAYRDHADDRCNQAICTLLPMMDHTGQCYFLLHGNTTLGRNGRPRTRRSRAGSRTTFHCFADDLASRPASANPYLTITLHDNNLSVGALHATTALHPPCTSAPSDYCHRHHTRWCPKDVVIAKRFRSVAEKDFCVARYTAGVTGNCLHLPRRDAPRCIRHLHRTTTSIFNFPLSITPVIPVPRTGTRAGPA